MEFEKIPPLLTRTVNFYGSPKMAFSRFRRPTVNFRGFLEIAFSRFSRSRRQSFLPGRRLNLQYDITRGILKDIFPVKSMYTFTVA